MHETSSEETTVDAVQAQYERWIYPPRVYDLASQPLMKPVWHFQNLQTLYWLFWPRAAFRDDLDILIAGCGSIAAAAHAHVYPRARVVGIDVSRGSLDHQNFLKRKHNLANLTLHHLRLEDVSSLGLSFDLINCCGVLHHLVDPVAGLRALGQVLRPDGVMDIMVYGKHARAGVAMIQDLFRVMGIEQDPAGVQAVKDTLKALPPRHPVQNYRRMAADNLSSDEGLVDTFLHRRDRPFSVSECLELVEQAGLAFQGWKENGFYHIDTRLPPSDPLWPALQKLSARQLWQAVEIMDCNMGGHWFHVCRHDRDSASYVIQFDDDSFLDYIPVARVDPPTPADPQRNQPAMIARPPFPPMRLDERQLGVFRHIDAQRSVRACLAAASLEDSPQTTAFARGFFRALWRAGYALFRLPESAKLLPALSGR